MDAVMPGIKIAPRSESLPVDPESFDAIYELYKTHVYRLACALADNAGDAEDLFQETWLRAVRSRSTALGTENAKSWLFTITVNLHRDGLRKKRIRKLFFLERTRAMAGRAADADPGWDSERPSEKDFAVRTDLRDSLREAISRLPARQREVFVLKDVEGYKHAEIGRMLGIPEPTVRTLFHRAVKNLQRHLAAFRPDGAGRPAAKEIER